MKTLQIVGLALIACSTAALAQTGTSGFIAAPSTGWMDSPVYVGGVCSSGGCSAVSLYTYPGFQRTGNTDIDSAMEACEGARKRPKDGAHGVLETPAEDPASYEPGFEKCPRVFAKWEAAIAEANRQYDIMVQAAKDEAKRKARAAINKALGE